jgi:hypothetical protein
MGRRYSGQFRVLNAQGEADEQSIGTGRPAAWDCWCRRCFFGEGRGKASCPERDTSASSYRLGMLYLSHSELRLTISSEVQAVLKSKSQTGQPSNQMNQVEKL